MYPNNGSGEDLGHEQVSSYRITSQIRRRNQIINQHGWRTTLLIVPRQSTWRAPKHGSAEFKNEKVKLVELTRHGEHIYCR